MSTQTNLCVPVCVRDGEQLVKIQIAGVEFQMDIGEFAYIIDCVNMDICHASAPVRRLIERFLQVANEVNTAACCLAPSLTQEEMKRNHKRWLETGIGGVQELQPVVNKLLKLNKAIREDWEAEKKKFAERDCRLFNDE